MFFEKQTSRWVYILSYLLGVMICLAFLFVAVARAEHQLSGYFVNTSVVCGAEDSARAAMTLFEQRDLSFDELASFGCATAKRAVMWSVKRVVSTAILRDFQGDRMMLLEIVGGFYVIGFPGLNTNAPAPIRQETSA